MKHAWQRLVHGSGLFILVTVLVTGMLVVQGISIYRSYQATWTIAARAADNALQTLGAQILRNLNVFDLTLTGLQKTITLAGLETLPDSVRHMLLFDRADGARYMGSLLALDKYGNIRFDSRSGTPRTENFSDRDYFLVHKTPNNDLYISRPFKSRLRGEEEMVVMSRRMSAPDGDLLGVAAAGLSTAYFNALFSEVDLGPESSMRIFNMDGVVLATQLQGRMSGPDPDFASSPLFHRMMEEPRQPFIMTSPADGVERYYVTSRIGQFPLILSVGISTEEILGEWRVQSLINLLLVLVDGALIIVLFVALRRALGKSQKMQAYMKSIAITDGLTGLPNRRAMDAALSQEMSRAVRDRHPLSVLMIDIDHFKAVNDRHGHSVGDEVLFRVGQTISRLCRGKMDLPTRYGGEEFIVLLPGAGLEAARRIAERIRAEVEQMTPSLMVEMAPVTVSIGVASTTPPASLSPAALLKDADAAMYAAKTAGRNRVMEAG
ncbi:sensor domain-containing diguanylate cyclase [Xanthobacter sp. TB0136]|uniref:sensor domain-containing diguanylate cyclase n=1 Tax=Xanthobacter sp. TB0136 TaxID=3459177 RepID=UPI004039E5AB